jgi:hypothetical protein
VITAPHKLFAPWVNWLSGILVVASLVVNRGFDITNPAAFALLAIAFAVTALSALAGLINEKMKIVVLKRETVACSDRETLLAWAAIYGCAALIFGALAFQQ